MRIEFLASEEEMANVTVMEKASAIWNHFHNCDEIRELIDYCTVAVEAEETRQRNRISPVQYETPYQSVTYCRGPRRSYARRVYSEDEE